MSKKIATQAIKTTHEANFTMIVRRNSPITACYSTFSYTTLEGILACWPYRPRGGGFVFAPELVMEPMMSRFKYEF